MQAQEMEEVGGKVGSVVVGDSENCDHDGFHYLDGMGLDELLARWPEAVDRMVDAFKECEAISKRVTASLRGVTGIAAQNMEAVTGMVRVAQERIDGNGHAVVGG